MVWQVLHIGRWSVDFFLCDGGGYDIPLVLGRLRDMEAPHVVLEQARGLMEDCALNCGFMFPDPVGRRAVVAVGDTTGGDEFLDTLVHELHHLAVAIAGSLGMSLEGEGPAYLAGDSARDLAGVICELGCGRCRC